MWPLTWAAFTIALQASVVVPTPSFTSTTPPVTPGCESAGPNDAVPNARSPAIAGGELTRTIGLGPRKMDDSLVTAAPLHTRWPVLTAEAARCPLVI